MVRTNPKVEKCLQLIQEYKSGNVPHYETIETMQEISGLSALVWDAFLTHVKKDNIIKFPTGGRTLDG